MVLYILTAEAHAVNMCWPSGLARAPTDVIVPPPEMAIFFRLCQEASQHFRGTIWVSSSIQLLLLQAVLAPTRYQQWLLTSSIPIPECSD